MTEVHAPQDRYYKLRLMATLFRVLAWLVPVAGLALLFIVRDVGDLVELVLNVVVRWAVLLLMAEGIHLAIDLAENTRRTAVAQEARGRMLARDPDSSEAPAAPEV